MKPAQRVADALAEFPINRANYVLVGSGPMALRNMRDVGDLDIFTTTSDWFDLIDCFNFQRILTASHDWRRRCDPPIASKVLAGIEVNAFSSWRLRRGDLIVNVSDEIAGAEHVEAYTSSGERLSIRCMKLERLIAWKLSAGREKDYADIAEIGTYLAQER